MPMQAYLEICLVLADGVAGITGGDIHMGMLCWYALLIRCNEHACRDNMGMHWMPMCSLESSCERPTCMQTAQAPAMMS